MKVFITFLLTLLIALLSTQAFSQQLIPFQARLTDGTGAPVVDGVYSINFSIYDVATGGVPVNGWVESHATVSVMSGVVNVILGGITLLNDPNNDGDLSDAVTFYTTDGNRFIGVTIGAGQEMVPRHQLVPSFHAVTADNAAKLGGEDPSYYISNADIQGMVGAFSGSCPTGWLLADGTSGTPDLRGKFIRGEVTADPASLDLGGNDDAIVVSHDHGIDPPATSISISSDGSHKHEGGTTHSVGAGYRNGRTAQIICLGSDCVPISGSTPVIEASAATYLHHTDTKPGHSHSASSVDTPAFNSGSAGSPAIDANIPGYYEVIYCVRQ